MGRGSAGPLWMHSSRFSSGIRLKNPLPVLASGQKDERAFSSHCSRWQFGKIADAATRSAFVRLGCAAAFLFGGPVWFGRRFLLWRLEYPLFRREHFAIAKSKGRLRSEPGFCGHWLGIVRFTLFDDLLFEMCLDYREIPRVRTVRSRVVYWSHVWQNIRRTISNHDL